MLQRGELTHGGKKESDDSRNFLNMIERSGTVSQ
jgi:hypothetical protein